MQLTVKWGKEEFTIEADEDQTVSGFKRKLEVETGVRSERQKLVGLKKLKGPGLPRDEDPLSSLQPLKPGAKLLMIGKLEEDIAAGNAAAAQASAAASVQDDFDDLGEDALDHLEIKDHPDNIAKLDRRVANSKIKELNPPTPGKHCLVLDIDFTIFDLGSAAERPEELARPYLHEFLEALYPFYNIVICMRWIEVKMRELGVTTQPDRFKVSLFLDHQSMVTVRDEKHGVFDCKPLPLLWRRYPEVYKPTNTVMLDDLRRNYVFNKQQGLVIRPYKHAARNRATDTELLRLKAYLLKIAPLSDFSGLRHSRWERYQG